MLWFGRAFLRVDDRNGADTEDGLGDDAGDHCPT